MSVTRSLMLASRFHTRSNELLAGQGTRESHSASNSSISTLGSELCGARPYDANMSANFSRSV